MLSDQETHVGQLKSVVRQFVEDRNWQRFHTPKNLVMALAVETSELMEHFQWVEGGHFEVNELSQEQISAIADELADVFCYAFALANVLQIDVSQAMLRKMEKNEQKYPVQEYLGRYQKPPATT